MAPKVEGTVETELVVVSISEVLISLDSGLSHRVFSEAALVVFFENSPVGISQGSPPRTGFDHRR